VSGERHRRKAVEAVESLTKTEVVGVVERRAERLPERHLGLVTIPEKESVEETVRTIGDLAGGVDLERCMEIAERGGDMVFPTGSPFENRRERKARIAVPMDRAYSFYYPENLESIEAAGGEIVRFRPVEGDPLPEADGYYLGGGYPEVYAKEISENKRFLEGIRSASENGKVVYAECGGLMTLCNAISDGEERYDMAGVFPHLAELTRERQGLAYVNALGTKENFLFPDKEIRGHEFHYSRLVPVPSGPFAYRVKRGTGIDGKNDGLVKGRTIGAYMHQHALANKDWGIALVDAASQGH